MFTLHLFADIVLASLLIICVYILNRKASQNHAMEIELMDQSSDISGLRCQKRDLENKLAMSNANVKEAKRNLANSEHELQNALEEFKEERNDLLSDIEERDAIIDKKTKLVAEKNKEIANLQLDLEQAQKNDMPRGKDGKFKKKKTTTKKAAKKK